MVCVEISMGVVVLTVSGSGAFCCCCVLLCVLLCFLFFQAEDGIRDLVRSRGLGDVYKRQSWSMWFSTMSRKIPDSS